MTTMERAAALGIAALATARLTRFFTSDTLGEWLFVGPAKHWAWLSKEPNGHLPWADLNALRNTPPDPMPSPKPEWGWRSKLVKGLDCPFCVGFWLGALVLLASMLRRVPVVGPVVRFGLGMLALNYLVGHVSSRIDG